MLSLFANALAALSTYRCQDALEALANLPSRHFHSGWAQWAWAAASTSAGAYFSFMLYIAAVLVAGLVRGPLCGGLVMLGGGLLGYELFLSPDGVAQKGSMLALMMFWGVATPVLATASELRSQLRDAMTRLSAAIDRKGNNRIIS